MLETVLIALTHVVLYLAFGVVVYFSITSNDPPPEEAEKMVFLLIVALWPLWLVLIFVAFTAGFIRGQIKRWR